MNFDNVLAKLEADKHWNDARETFVEVLRVYVAAGDSPFNPRPGWATRHEHFIIERLLDECFLTRADGQRHAREWLVKRGLL